MIFARYTSLVLAVLVLGSAYGQPASAQTPSPEALDPATLTGKITYAYEDDVYVMNADGTMPTRLTTDPEMDFDPSWSPDGTMIAFRSHRDGNDEIYLMRSDGSDQTNLTQHRGSDFSPAWSPDGKQIAFASERAGDPYPNLYLINIDGTGLISLTNNESEGEYPSWSPDGTRIVFACYQGGGQRANTSPNYDICVINRDGTGLQNLTNEPAYDFHPAWSPDGTMIAFMSERDGWPTLPGYTPLGYESARFGDREIYLMEADGSNPVNLTQFPREDDEMPTWSQDGLLMWSRYGCFMVMDPATLIPAQLTRSAQCVGSDAGMFADWLWEHEDAAN